MERLSKSPETIVFPIMKEVSLDACNNKILFLPSPESKVEGLPIKSLLIAIDFSSPDSSSNCKLGTTTKENQSIEEKTQPSESAEKTTFHALDEEISIKCGNMDSNRSEQLETVHESSFFDINEINSSGDVCDTLNSENPVGNVSSVNNSVNEDPWKSYDAEGFDFQEKEDWEKVEFVFSSTDTVQDKMENFGSVSNDTVQNKISNYENDFSDVVQDKTPNFENVSNDRVCEAGTSDKQTDTSDLFEVYRDSISPKLPKWMNKMGNFKSAFGQVKLKRPFVPNLTRHLMRPNDNDLESNYCVVLENHNFSKREGGNRCIARAFDTCRQERIKSCNLDDIDQQNGLLNTETEKKGLQQSVSDTDLYNSFEASAILQNVDDHFLSNTQSFSSTDGSKKKKEAIVKPFGRFSTEEFVIESTEPSQEQIDETQTVNRLDETLQISADHLPNLTSNCDRYLVTKPIMFRRSSKQLDGNTNVVSVQLCSSCFDLFIRSEHIQQDQRKFSESKLCSDNEHAEEVANSFSLTLPDVKHNDDMKNLQSSQVSPSQSNFVSCKSFAKSKLLPTSCPETEKSLSQDTLSPSRRSEKFAGHREREAKFLAPSSRIQSSSPQSISVSGSLNNEPMELRKPDENLVEFGNVGEPETNRLAALSSDRNIRKRNTEKGPSLNKAICPYIDEIRALSRPDYCIDSEEFKTACEIIKWHLENPEWERDESLKAAVLLVQEKWFEISGSKKSKSEVVRNFLHYFQKISPRLLTFVVNSVCPDGNTVLHFAVVNSQFDVIKEVLRIRSCDVDKPNKAGNTPIIISAACHIESEEDEDIIQQLLFQGNINFRSLSMGQTALMMAVNLDNIKMVQLLLDCGANVNIQDNDGSTALMYACHGGKIATAMILIRKPDSEFAITDNDGFTAFDIAMQRQHINICLLIYIRANGETTWPIARQNKTSSASTCSTKSFPHSQKSRNSAQKKKRRENHN